MNEAVPRSKERICVKLGATRGWFYESRKARNRKSICEDLVMEFVREERKVNPGYGTDKLIYVLKPRFEEAGFTMGRDRLNAIIKRHGMLLTQLRKKKFTTKTTKQDPSLPVAPNLVKDMKITDVNQAVCADITYIYSDEGFIFLSLIMDMFARDIVGWSISDTLGTEDGALKALEMAFKTLPATAAPVHHSDRGCQYGSHLYRDTLAAHGWTCSMTEELHCYENAMAERLNGILKTEYGLDFHFKTKAEAIIAIKQAIMTYNHRRIHESLGYKTPAQCRAEAMAKAA